MKTSMKKILNCIPLLGVAMAFAACESDLDGVTYNPGNATPAVLGTLPETAYVLESRNSDNTAFTLQWSAPDFGYDAIVTNLVQLDLSSSDNFATAYTMASTIITTTSFDITVGTLNSAVLNVLRSNGLEEDLSARDFKIRIASYISTTVDSLYSNEITLNITPYDADIQYPEVYVIGDYSGWGWDTAQSLFSFSEDGINYEGLIDFGSSTGGGFKLTGDQSWDNGNYGVDGDAAAPEDEAASVTLINDGGSGNISCYSHRFYHFSFSTETLVLTNNLSFDQMGIIGLNGDWDNDVVMDFDADKQHFYADVPVSADTEFKFRADAGWDINYGGTDGVLTAGGDNIPISAGNYRIYLDMNNSNSITYELSTDDYGAE